MLSIEIVLDDIIRKVESNILKAEGYDSRNSYIFFYLTDDIIYSKNRNSRGTDITPTNCYVCKDEKEIYYVLGKINEKGNEEIHIYYQQGNEFNAMLCKYVTGGEYENNNRLNILLKTLIKSVQ